MPMWILESRTNTGTAVCPPSDSSTPAVFLVVRDNDVVVSGTTIDLVSESSSNFVFFVGYKLHNGTIDILSVALVHHLCAAMI